MKWQLKWLTVTGNNPTFIATSQTEKEEPLEKSLGERLNTGGADFTFSTILG